MTMESTCDLMAFSYCGLFKVTVLFLFSTVTKLFYLLNLFFVDFTTYMSGFRLDQHPKEAAILNCIDHLSNVAKCQRNNVAKHQRSKQKGKDLFWKVLRKVLVT